MDDPSDDQAAPAQAAEAVAPRAAARAGAFLGVPIEVTISVGKARPLVSELVELRRDSVLTLDSSIDDPVELYIGDRLIARGELQELGDDSGRLGVRLTEVATPDAEGKPVWAPRPIEEIETLRTLVQSAVGFDAERGDTVTIESLQFTALPEAGTLAERNGSGWLADNGARLAQIGVLGAIVMALIFFVLRPMMSRRPTMALADLTGLREFAPETARMLGVGDGGGAGGDILDLPAASATKIDRLRELIASRSEDSAAVLRAWIESPETRKEPAQT